MTLTLSMLRTPAGVVPETRRVDTDAVSLGRGSDNDWVLPDPERVLSKQHCVIRRQADGPLGGGHWQVVDSSSNGTFLNGRCLDPGVARAITDGDRLAFGAYEIEARIAEPADSAAQLPEILRDEGLAERRLTGDPFPRPETAWLGSAGLPADFNRLGEDGIFGAPPALADHTPALQAQFVPPRAESELLPADWDAEWLSAVNTQTRPAIDTSSAPVTVPPVAAPMPAGAEADGATLARALALVTAGAGIEGMPRGRPAEALAALGRALRAMVVGLRRTMIARAAVKGEYRIEQTMIQASGNNPLKFSADDDDALAALLGIGRSSAMPAETAVAEALDDIRLHDLAVAASMQHAVREMLNRLDPVAVRATLPAHRLDRFFGLRDRRAWREFVRLHNDVARAFTDDFDSVFGRNFARNYEQVQADLAAQNQEPAP